MPYDEIEASRVRARLPERTAQALVANCVKSEMTALEKTIWAGILTVIIGGGAVIVLDSDLRGAVLSRIKSGEPKATPKPVWTSPDLSPKIARDTAQKFVTRVVRSPATAKFSPESETTVENLGEGFRVKGWVESRNSAGTMQRKSYSIRVWRVQGEDWEGDELEFTE